MKLTALFVIAVVLTASVFGNGQELEPDAEIFDVREAQINYGKYNKI